MKFPIEQFKKLKQLDRIEFRQKARTLTERFSFSWNNYLLVFIYNTILLWSFFMLAFLGAPYYGDQWFIQFSKLFSITGFILLVQILILIPALLIRHFGFLSNRKKLLEEYFPKLLKRNKK